jgi:hypothetical protein
MTCPFQRKEKEEARTKTLDYAKPSDFCKMFADHLEHFYTLALLLTADPQKAEQCFVSGLDDSLHGTPVFREWAQSWAKRSVIKSAIRMIFPLRGQAVPTSVTFNFAAPLAVTQLLLHAILSLSPFDRFVYVLSVLENVSDRECSMLLDCTVAQVAKARTKTLQRLGSTLGPNVALATTLAQVPERLNQSYGEVL